MPIATLCSSLGIASLAAGMIVHTLSDSFDCTFEVTVSLLEGVNDVFVSPFRKQFLDRG